MNNNQNNFSNPAPYRASTNNYNTSISNPSMQVGDRMRVNIQNENLSSEEMTSNQYISNQWTSQPQIQQTTPQPQVQNYTPNSFPYQSPSQPQTPIEKTTKEKTDVTEMSYNSATIGGTVDKNVVTYVSNMNIPQKKKEAKLSSFLTSEVKITILIVVVLILCITVFPSIYDAISEFRRNMS